MVEMIPTVLPVVMASLRIRASRMRYNRTNVAGKSDGDQGYADFHGGAMNSGSVRPGEAVTARRSTQTPTNFGSQLR